MNVMKGRNRAVAEAKKQFYKECYQTFLHSGAYSMCCYAISAVLFAMVRRGRKKEYIQKLYEDILFILEYPEFYGKQITLTEVMKMLTEEYEIDFSRIKLSIETEQEFVQEMKND